MKHKPKLRTIESSIASEEQDIISFYCETCDKFLGKPHAIGWHPEGKEGCRGVHTAIHKKDE
jgi:hypothetical protein